MSEQLNKRMQELEPFRQAQGTVLDSEVNNYDPFASSSPDSIDYLNNAQLQAVSLSYYADPSIEYPQHLAQLDLLPFSEDEKLDLLDAYNGAESQDLSQYMNVDILIHGCVLWYYPPYVGKYDASKGEVPEVKPGYYKVLLLTDLKNALTGAKIILGTSSVTVGQTCFYLMQKKGWYIWRDLETGKLTPKKFRFTRANSTAPYRMQNVARMESNGEKK